MNLLPYRSFDLSVHDPPDIVTERLRRVLGSDTRRFRGRVDAQAFRFRPRGFLTNVLRPTLYGSLRPDSTGTTVHVDLIPSPFVLGVVVFLLVMLTYLVFVANGQLVILLAFGSVVLSWFFLLAGLWFDTGRSRQALTASLKEGTSR